MEPQAALRIERMNYILGGLAAVASALLLSKEIALGVLVGAIISAINFSLLRRLVQGVLRSQEDRPSVAAVLFIPKMAALIVAVTLAILYLPVSPVAIAVGFSVFLVSIGVETVRYMTSSTTHG